MPASSPPAASEPAQYTITVTQDPPLRSRYHSSKSISQPGTQTDKRRRKRKNNSEGTGKCDRMPDLVVPLALQVGVAVGGREEQRVIVVC
eukprot:1312488-Rhodomonas_salina.1